MEMFPDASSAPLGKCHAWHKEDFVQAAKAPGKKQLIVVGIVTQVFRPPNEGRNTSITDPRVSNEFRLGPAARFFGFELKNTIQS